MNMAEIINPTPSTASMNEAARCYFVCLYFLIAINVVFLNSVATTYKRWLPKMLVDVFQLFLAVCIDRFIVQLVDVYKRCNLTY